MKNVKINASRLGMQVDDFSVKPINGEVNKIFSDKLKVALAFYK